MTVKINNLTGTTLVLTGLLPSIQLICIYSVYIWYVPDTYVYTLYL